MRDKFIYAAIATIFIAYRVLAVSNFQPQTALSIAQSQGVPTTILGTIVPILPKVVPLITVYLAIGAFLTALIPRNRAADDSDKIPRFPALLLAAAIVAFGVSLVFSDAGGQGIDGLIKKGVYFSFRHGWKVLPGAFLGFIVIAIWFSYDELQEVVFTGWKASPSMDRKASARAIWRVVRASFWPALIKIVRAVYRYRRKRAVPGDGDNPAKLQDGATSKIEPGNRDGGAAKVNFEVIDTGGEPRLANRAAGTSVDQVTESKNEYDAARILISLAAAILFFTALGFPDGEKLAVDPAQVTRSMWAPEEALVVQGKTSVTVGYVLEVDRDWTTILVADSRTITYIRTGEVLSRTQCRGNDQGLTEETGLPFWPTGIVKTPLPTCDSIKPPS